MLSFSTYWLAFILLFHEDYSIKFDKNILYLRNSGQLDVLIESVYDYVDGSENFFFDDYYGYLINYDHYLIILR